ncbi:transglutaminase TgpA family protein [Paenibacillus agricola]|uniref:Transglutaminase domain-containing protein n=1 Tax=Paenibacillus agricola TaxID=2716264 RepID=A0ABX0J822_9BACL|nr:transglutaminase domain-containing protein [Paenibacillus agricola]NHN30988.1 transglutaminase domain-containing protein [Paenibacillus agricola]
MSGIVVEKKALWRRLLLSDWTHRLSVLLVGLFLLQFVIWITKENGLWLPETVRIVQLTLLVTFLLEHVPKLHWIIRGLLQLMAVITLSSRVLQSTGVIENVTLSSYFSSQLFLNLYQLTPYLWFALSAWVIYLALIWWVEVKWRVYLLMIVSVLGMCIRDSFSNVYLWPQVAMVLGCGLFLLILCHFQQLRRKDPTAWSYLADYPTSIAVPVISLVCLTLSIGSIMPEVSPVLTDPYTAWRNYQGQPVNFTTGKGVEVATAITTGDASSGYSRNDTALGSGFEFDFTPVMTVDTTHRSYWRGETRALYNGKGWELGDSDRRAQVTNVRADAILATDPKAAGSKLKTVEITQNVTILSEETYPVLFGALNIQKVVDMSGVKTGLETLLWAPTQSELRFNESQRQAFPKSYTVVSQMPIINEEELRLAPNDLPNRAELTEYLQVPENMPNRVRLLAAEITKDTSNPYDKAKKIEQYLRQTYPYTNKPDLTKGRSRDFVDRFLFEIKEGYCDYFSSAMAVLARSSGLPTRWVKGYASGATAMPEEYLGMSEEQGLLDPDAAGVYTVRNADAHSWVEVYFAGYGWVPFEPTSGFLLPQAAQTVETVIDPATLPDAPVTVEETASFTSPGHIAGITGIVISVAALIVFLFWKLQVMDLIRERVERRRASLLKQKVIVECERMLRICRRNGYTRDEHETLREATSRWIKQSKWMKADLEQVLTIFEKAKYSNAEITETDFQSTTQIVEKLRSQF